MQYDLIVLGGGPGGYLAAERAGEAGLRTLLVEKRAIGGVCLNEGCIPTKTLLHSAKILDYAKHGEVYGVSCEAPVLHHETVLNRKDRVVKKLVAGVNAGLKKNDVDVKLETGMITGKSADGILVSAGGETYTGARLVIATGSQPVIPPIPGLWEAMKSGFALTSGGMLQLRELPARLVIIGGGVIGLEMAAYFAAAGSQVTVVELMPKIAGAMDGDISSVLQRNLERRGVVFRLGAKAARLETDAVVMEKDGAGTRLPCDRVLLSIGRRPSIQDIGLEKLQAVTGRGSIVIDDQCLTNVPNVYAVGDCTGRSMLAHTAYRQAEVAVNTMLGKKDRMRYCAVPGIIYTNPEVATVGLTLKAARAAGRDAAAVSLPMNYAGRYTAENERGDGICKLIFDRTHKTLIGAHMAGGPSSEFILSCGILIETEMTLSHMKELIFPHPTVCEIIREAIFQMKL